MLKKKLVAFGLATAVLGASVSVGATTYISKTLTGTNAETGYAKLDDGKRYLKGAGVYGTGNAYAMKVISYFPDSSQTSISLSKDQSANSSFSAVSTSSDGANQSYYIRWAGSASKSSADLKITD